MTKYRIVFNEAKGEYAIQERFLLFFWYPVVNGLNEVITHGSKEAAIKRMNWYIEKEKPTVWKVIK